MSGKILFVVGKCAFLQPDEQSGFILCAGLRYEVPENLNTLPIKSLDVLGNSFFHSYISHQQEGIISDLH